MAAWMWLSGDTRCIIITCWCCTAATECARGGSGEDPSACLHQPNPSSLQVNPHTTYKRHPFSHWSRG
jgi:hypothetical protein